MICHHPSPGPVPHPTDPVPDSAAADRAALSLASKPITAIFTPPPGCRPGTQHAKPAAIPDGRCTWRLSGCVPTVIHVERVTVARVTGAGDGELNPHYQLGKSVALLASYLLNL
jgi:hypothetical protein